MYFEDMEDIEYRKAIIMQNGMTVQDLVDICKNNNLPMSTKISTMGIADNIVVNIKADDTMITLDEENLICDSCTRAYWKDTEQENCSRCPYTERNDEENSVCSNCVEDTMKTVNEYLRDTKSRLHIDMDDDEFFEELIMQYNDCIYGKGDYDE